MGLVPKLQTMGYSRKKSIREEGLRTCFFENPPRMFRFFILPLETPDKTKLHPKKLHKNCATSHRNYEAKTKTAGSSTRLFLDHPQKFYVVFN